MEIKDINPTAEATFTVIGTDGSEQSVSFTVTFLGAHMVPDYVRPAESGKFRMSRMIQEALVDVVTGWDLTIDGKAVPCTEENKRKFFPAILGLKLTDRKDDLSPDALLGWALVNFAGEQENFLKN